MSKGKINNPTKEPNNRILNIFIQKKIKNRILNIYNAFTIALPKSQYIVAMLTIKSSYAFFSYIPKNSSMI